MVRFWITVFVMLLLALAVTGAPPAIVSPADSSTWTADYLVFYKYTVGDAKDNCTLYVDDTIEDIDKAVIVGPTINLSAPAVPGDHDWYIRCENGGGNESSAVRTITVDYNGTNNLTLLNLGQAGFEQTNPEYTSLRTVVADAQFSGNKRYCAYKNHGELWSQWEACVDQKYWLLSDENGLKTVWIKINHTDLSLAYAYDTIELDKRGQGLDTTPPLAPQVIDDGDFTGNNATLHFRWEGGYDRESELLRIPLQYYFRINNTNYSSWNNVTSVSEITIPVNLVEYQNYTIEIQVVNSGNLTNMSWSDGITIDLTAPTRSGAASTTYAGGWTSNNTITFDWDGLFAEGSEGSGVGAYSFTMSSKNNTQPDSIPEGTAGQLENKTNHTFAGLASGEYYFHLTARDKAGNWGTGASVFHSNVIQIDITPPGIPNMINAVANSSSGSVIYNWSAASDSHSGVAGYYLQVSTTKDYSGRVINFTAGNVTSYEAAVPTDGTWYARVRAFDAVGNYGFFSDLFGKAIDVTPPRFLFTRPNGNISENPRIVVITDETAVCTHDGMEFDFTNSTYHESKPNYAEGTHSVTVVCTDSVGLTNSTIIDFTYDSTFVVTFVGVTAQSYTFTNREGKATVQVFTGGVPLGEIGKSRWTVDLEGVPVEFSLEDRTNGTYIIKFPSPPENALYELNVSVDGISDQDNVNVSDLRLGVVFTSVQVSAQNMNQITWTPYSGMAVGFGTDSKVSTISSSSGQLGMSMGSEFGSTYIFFTQSNPKLNSKEDLLKSKDFFDMINPSFGYPISDTAFVRAKLDYSDIILVGNRKLPSGKYSIVLRNAGLDDSDRTLIAVSVI